MILCFVVMGRTAVVYGVPVPIAFPLGLLVGLLCGALNGLLVTMLRLPPFIVTLGTWSIFGALNTWYSRSETIRAAGHGGRGAVPAVDRASSSSSTICSESMGLDLPLLKGWVVTYGSMLMIVLAIIVSGTCSTARPSAGTSMRPATIPTRRGSRASTPTAR